MSDTSTIQLPAKRTAHAALFFLGALVVRVAMAWPLRGLEFAQTLGLDAAFYHDWAQKIGREPFGEAFFQGPLYPYTLAGVYTVFGASISAAQWFQLGLGAMTAALVFLMGTELFSRRVAITGAALFALYPYSIFLETHLVAAPLLTFLVALGTWLALMARRQPAARRWALVGLCVGAMILGRGVFLPAFLIVAVVWIARAGESRPAALRATGIMLAVAALVILPTTIHNLRAGGGLVLVSANGGINYTIGNHADATGVFQPIEGVEFFQAGRGADGGSRALAERESGRSMNAAQASRYWWQKGLTWNLDHPGATTRLWGKKFLMAISDYEIPQIENFGWAKDQSALLRYHPVRFGWLCAFALVGAGLVVRRRLSNARVVVLLAGGYLLAMLPFFITARYRVVLVPLLCILAAYTLAWLVNALRRSDAGALISGGTALIALLLVVHLYTPAGVQASSENLRSYSRGVVAMQAGDFTTAIREFTEAAREQPDHVPTLANLGFCLLQSNRSIEGIRVLETALRLEPTNANVLEPYANALLQANRLADAERALQSLLQLNPSDDWTLARLGDVAKVTGDSERSRHYWNQVLSVSEDQELLATARARLQELGP